MSEPKPAGFRPRTLEFESEMSPGESLMWRVATDPWLDPSGSLVAPLDQPLDMAILRAKLANGVASVPRLAERVIDSSNPLNPPRWEVDPEFDLDNHLLEVDVDAPGDHEALLRLAAKIHTQPFDTNRPPWLMYNVNGLADGKGALISRLHHSIADGIGALRMSELYLDIERTPERPPPVDLDKTLAERIAAASHPKEQNPLGILTGAITGPANVLKAAAAELALIGADPGRLRSSGESLTHTLRSTMEQLAGDKGADSVSQTWAGRSGERVLTTARASLAAIRAAGKSRGGTLNDVFVAAMAHAGAAYHAETGESLDFLSMSYVRSTRTGSGVGGNAFSPIRITAPVADHDNESRYAALAAAMMPSDSASTISLDTVNSVAALLPTAAVTRLGRDQGRRIDIVTSNIRSASFPIFIGGAEVEATYPIGPVAGAACNATLMSYNGSLDIGIMIDPSAIAEPHRFAALVQSALDEYAAES